MVLFFKIGIHYLRTSTVNIISKCRYTRLDTKSGNLASRERQQPLKCAEKNPHLCRVDAFENPLFSVGALCLGFGSHCEVGLQAPNR